MLYGPFWAATVGGVSDIVYAVLLSGGTYFPGITLSAILTGVVFGLFLHNRKEGWLSILLAAGVNCLVISLGLTTFWLHLLYDTPYLTLMVTRVLQCGVMLPIQFAVLRLLRKPVFLYGGGRFSMS
ncbi:MAG: hypothetical protein H6Q60_1010 [Oscillospiraceae bacterium]|nr:hypothetical protein [Oscillospiraceae bacterium]